MIKNIDELKLKLSEERVTEHSHVNVELKRSWAQENGKKISMLANALPNEISFLVIGVEDNGKLSGHRESWLKNEIEALSQHLNLYLDPSITILELITEDINGSKVIIATLKNPGIVVKWNHKAYWGKGTTKKELTPEDILELNLQLPGLTDITKKKFSHNILEDNLKIFCNIIGIQYDLNVLDRFHLKDTKCSDLLFNDGTFRFIKFDDNDDIFLNETRKGLINAICNDFYDEVRAYYKDIISDNQRLSDKLFREALGNSIGHAAYNDNNGEIVVELHRNRMVFSNLAYQDYINLANKWFSSAHKSPNPFLMEVLRTIGKVDELGTGKKKLFAECLSNGFEAPYITITDAGRNKRWNLIIPISEIDSKYKKLKDRITDLYKCHKEKSLIAFALVLWSNKKFSEIAKYFDAFEAKTAAEVFLDFEGPVWLYEEEDRLVLHRWVKVLIQEGKESKGFNEYEEEKLYEHCKNLKNKYSGGNFSSKEFREFAHMSNSSSDKVLCSNMIAKWIREGKVKRLKKGKFKFVNTTTVKLDKQTIEELLKKFQDKLNE